jgi:peptidoglycan hydrolase-like protein with peptidoglycan-binding domain
MNLKRIVIAGTAAAGILAGGAMVATPASADTRPYHPVSGYWPVLKPGHKSENVRALQWLLSCHGYHQPAPSHYGPKTTANVKAFQLRYLNEQDGNTGALTWHAIVKSAPYAGYGQRNHCVKALQVLLNKWKYNDDLPITGYHGDRTKRKLHRFQAAHGIQANGAVDVRTYHKLVSTPAGK